jgi:signal transduction histidine kinase
MTARFSLSLAVKPIELGFVLLGLAAPLDASAATAEPHLPLTTARQIHQLTSDEATKAYPVRIRGVVTSYDIVVNQLFVQDATEGIYIEIGASALVTNDIVDLPLFALELRQSSRTNSVSQYLRGELTASTQARLAAYTGGPDPDLHVALVVDLNRRILGGSSLYDPRRFEGVALSTPTRALLVEASRNESAPGRRNSREAVTSRLNRLLVEDAYPACISTNRNPERFGFTIEVGQVLEIEGISARGGFAPDIIPATVKLVGRAELPVPRRVTFEQMAGGQQDCSWVEFSGVVRSSAVDEFTTLPALNLAGAGGRVIVPIQEADRESCERLIDSEVTVRGVCTTQYNRKGQLIRVAVQASTMSDIQVAKPAPASPDAGSTRRINTLLRYAPQEAHGHRVKVEGVVVLQQPGRALVIADETQGLYILTRQTTPLRPGDKVEVLGFPLAGEYVSPVLEDAAFRKLGQGRPLTAKRVTVEEARLGRNDATLVEMEAVLLNRVPRERDQILELQAGEFTFHAEVHGSPGKNDPLTAIPNHSRVRLTGVCLVRPDQDDQIGPSRSFSLLLDSATDIVLLARPSWWTVEHALWVLVATVAVSLASLAWVAVLRKQVRAQMQVIRQKVQREAALEERTRIARDLHDDLGSSLTQITLLSDRSENEPLPELQANVRKISVTAREMAQSLDAIVWAVNPKHDTLDGLVEYLSQYADDFLEDTPIHCRLKLPPSLPGCTVLAEVRHQLFLAFAEALNNAVRHSAASEIQIELTAEPAGFRIQIADNGVGFDPASARAGGNGLKNMRQRLEDIGGRFELSSQPGQGSQIRLAIPLSRN